MSAPGAHERHASAILLAIALTLIMIATPVADALTPAGSVQTMNVTIPSNESLNVFSPSPSSLILLSVVGAQYEIQYQNGVPVTGLRGFNQTIGDEIVFTPGNSSVYSLNVSVSSAGPTYALVREGTPPLSSPLKNITGSGTYSLDIRITVTPSPTHSSGWSALFGFTGLSIGEIGFNVTDALIALAIASVALIASGEKYNRKLLGIGLLLLIGMGLVILGFLVTGVVLALYLASFILVRSRLTLKARRSGTEGGGAS